MGGKPYQEHFFLTTLQKTGSTQRQGKGLGGISPRDTEDWYHVLKDKSDYVELGENYVDDRGKASQIKYHKEALKNPGVDLPDTQSA